MQDNKCRFLEENMSSDEESQNGGQHCHVDNSMADRLANRKATRKLIIATVLCLVFMIIEVVGGIVANSLAIATDAAHLLSDLASFFISLAALCLSSRPPTMRMSYGWYRAEVLGAMCSVLIIWLVTIVLVYLAVLRVIYPDYEINASIMMITAALSVAFNLLMMLVLQGHGHTHGGISHSHVHSNDNHSQSDDFHDHKSHDEISHDKKQTKSMSYKKLSADYGSMSSIPINTNNPTGSIASANNAPDDNGLETSAIQQTKESVNEKNSLSLDKHNVGHQEENINVRAAFIHVIGDLIQSFGVLIASYVIYYKPEWKIVDPICTFIFSILVMLTTARIIGDVFRVLMEGSPSDISFEDIKATLGSIDGVIEVHDLHIWSLTTTRTALSAHLALKKGVNGQEIVSFADQILKNKYGINKSTIQVENYVIEMESCSTCKGPTN